MSFVRYTTSPLDSEPSSMPASRPSPKNEWNGAGTALHTLIVSMPDLVIWEADVQLSAFSQVSAGAESVLGYDTDLWLSEREFWATHLHPEDRERILTWCRTEAASGRDHECEYRMVRADGRTVWVRHRASCLRDTAGNVTGVQGVLSDITELVTAREAANAINAQLHTMAEVIPQQVWTTTPDGALDFVNSRVLRYFGRSYEQMIGWGWKDVIHPDDVERCVARWTQSLSTGQPYELEFRLLDHATAGFRWHLALAQAQRDAEGRITRWFGTNTDIHDYKQLQTALQETANKAAQALKEAELERARLTEVFAQAPAAIAVTEGPEHTFVSANGMYTAMTGNRPLIGRTVREAFPEVLPQYFEMLDQVYRTGEAIVGNEQQTPIERNGRIENGWFNFIYQPLRDVRQRTTGIIIIAVDITDQVLARKRVEELATALERSNKDLDQFAYVASHDLKAPLRGIANLSQWVEEDLGPAIDADARKHLDLMRSRVHRMESLIDGILDYSRAGRAKHKPERVDVSALVHDTIELISPPAHVRIEASNGFPVLETEKVSLQQVFMNLIGNAVKHARVEGPVISVTARAAQEGWEFCVADNGQGIAPEFHERIWTIFQTLEARDTVEGAGIGLAVVKRMVETRGGRVWVDSSVGTGARFYFTWPARDLAEEPKP